MAKILFFHNFDEDNHYEPIIKSEESDECTTVFETGDSIDFCEFDTSRDIFTIYFNDGRWYIELSKTDILKIIEILFE